MKPMRVQRQRGRIKITLTGELYGDDLYISIMGGDVPHIGALSYGDAFQNTVTYSFGSHKEGVVTAMISEALKNYFSHKFVVVCGIHVDNINSAEIEDVLELCKELICDLIVILREKTS